QLARDAATHAAAIEVYVGDLLEDNYDDWVVGERERLRARYLTILTASLERFCSQRAYSSALTCAKRILTEDPWREDTLRALLAIRYEVGDTAGALAAFEQFAKRLRDELGVAPMPETIAVRQSILRNEALPGFPERTPAPPEIANRAPSAMLPFVARRDELDKLQAAWSRAARGTGTFVLLSGEAGVGKTRLCAELARIVQSEGGRVYIGTTAAPESTPYQSIIEALRSALPLLLARPPVTARRAALAHVLPELRDPAAPDVALPEMAADREIARIYDALADAIRRLASPRPLLLILEDLQWAGSATIEALGEIVKELLRTPVLIVATYREEEVTADHPLRTLLRSLAVFQNVGECLLERFAEGDVAELIGRIDALRGRPATFAHDLYAYSEGNALFLNELIGGVLESGTIGEAAETSIEAMVAARTAQLGENALTVAQIAAVAGSGCSVSLVRDVSNLSATKVATGFDELLDRRILREAGARANHDYVFTHHLIADAMYAGIEPAFRARRHSRIARVLQANARADVAPPAREIARHHECAGDREAAAAWYVTAARSAAAIHAYGDAIDLATLALKTMPPVDIRYAALDIRERAYGRRGHRNLQREDIEELERVAGNDASQRFDVLTRRVLFERTLGESDEEGRVIAEMHDLAESLGDDARARALVQSATHAGLRSRPADALDPALGALEIYERLGDVHGQLECLYLLVDFAANMGDVDASREYLARMRVRAGSLADQVVEARALAVAAQAALLRQEYRTSFDLSAQTLALQLATNDRDGEASSRGRIAVAAAWLADFTTALREFDLALETYASIGNKRGLALTHTNRTLLLMRLGLFNDALASIRQSNELFAIAHEQRTIVANQVNESFVRLQIGDALTAKQLAASALGHAKEIAFPIFEAAALANLGNAERALGDHTSAIEHMEAGIALRRPLQNERDFVDDLADLTLAYVAAGRTTDAFAASEQLIAIGSGSFEGALWPHYIRWAIAQGLAAGGAEARANEAAIRARRELEAFAGRIGDERTRQAFLAVPVNKTIAMGE
ncbi:MAG: AAA family ATPase, partial [Candidatus Eremiobacteraeota bacterium]|nr:AAA family ATPase [Candidatus Eremiobacteraeota bacterium]